MGIRIGFNPSAPHSGMGEKFAGPGGQGAGMPSGMWGSNVPTFSPQDIGWQGYNPAVIAAGMPSVNTGNDNYPIPNFAPSQWGTYDMPISNPTDWYANPTSGWESFPAGTYPGGGAYGFPAQMNPAFNIDNIVQPVQDPSLWNNIMGIPSVGPSFGGAGHAAEAGGERGNR